MSTQTIGRLSLFACLSLVWSYFVFVHRPFAQLSQDWPYLLSLLLGWAPALGTLIMALILRPRIPNLSSSLTGGHGRLIAIMLAVPIICLSIFGVFNAQNIHVNLFGLFLGFQVLIYALLEEYGWRGYMQEELKILNNKWLSYIVIGLIWYLWHWFFLRSGGNTDLRSNLTICLLLIAASAGIGEILKATKSIAAAACFHALGNIAFFYPLIVGGLTNTEKWITVAACLIVWIPIVKRMERLNAQTDAQS